jgi:DNA replication protein DnaC
MEQVAETANIWHERVERARKEMEQNDRLGISTYSDPLGVSEADRIAWEARWERRIPKRYRHARVEQLEGDLKQTAGEWDGDRNVLLLGNVGAGKTHAAVAMARTVHDNGREVMFRASVNLLDELRPDGPPEAFKRATRVPLLLLDDLGAERRTDWTADRIAAVLVQRYDECLPTIVTSNLIPDALEATVGPRIYSRLYDDALRLKVAGDDRRRAA